MFQFGMKPTTINKLTRGTKHTASARNHIIRNSLQENNFKTEIIRADISDHIPIVYAFKLKETFRSKVLKEKYELYRNLQTATIQNLVGHYKNKKIYKWIIYKNSRKIIRNL